MASEFFDRVYRVVRLIPEGRVSTYGHIARFLGTGRSARLVGYAMNASHNDPTVPAHRVVNRKGLLTGKHFFGGSTVMEDLLTSEGITVVDDEIQNFGELVWDPMDHLDQEEFRVDLDFPAPRPNTHSCECRPSMHDPPLAGKEICIDRLGRLSYPTQFLEHCDSRLFAGA